ncbi:Trm112 family protein [Cumulibacter soli]|uniref:Trm112 family protein n=1 Tax=Cumulibacter soli TaxID=2546344 RepID=UPI0010679D4D|nr:Trm112 family protein [Cumulibacter soli]
MALIDPQLLALLACPSEDHAPLVEVAPGTADGGEEGSLRCSACSRIFPIREGIPVLLLDDAR